MINESHFNPESNIPAAQEKEGATENPTLEPQSVVDPETQAVEDAGMAAKIQADKEQLAEIRRSLREMSDGAEAGETIDDVKEQIFTMTLADQYTRENWETAGYDPEIDKTNTELLQKIIQKHGWPTISKFGEQASQDAWLIAQHADHDVAFQEQCLEMMKANKEDIDRTCIAYLEDRVLKNTHKPQKYGTQFMVEDDGKLVPYAIEDIEDIEKRRSEAGLEPYADYYKRMTEKQ